MTEGSAVVSMLYAKFATKTLASTTKKVTQSRRQDDSFMNKPSLP